MKNKKINAVHVWKQLEDLAVPRLHLSVIERAVYSHLLRHSRLEGKLELRFSILWLARGACLSTSSVRQSVRSLVSKGALRLAERSRAGHVAEVRLPEEIRSVRAGEIAARDAVHGPSAGDLETADFLESRALREAIHAREGGFCFYCLSRLTPIVRGIDHVVPRVRGGRNGYRNLVSSCAECNSQKGEQLAEDFLRWLCREGRLSTGELSGRFRALAKLTAGKLRPSAPAKREERTTRAS
jgi:5-methylcytosine-specific restriction endonuclease McrA